MIRRHPVLISIVTAIPCNLFMARMFGEPIAS